MPELFVTSRDGKEFSVQGRPGLSVMEVVRASGSEEIIALCGGACSCATCHVYVDETFIDRLPEPSDFEKELLEFSEHRRDGSRLSCQLPFDEPLDGLRIVIAPEE